MSTWVKLSEEKIDVKRALKTELFALQKWHVVNMKWVLSWKRYVDFESDKVDERTPEVVESFHPGAIDNSELLDESGGLKRDIAEGRDFVLFPSFTSGRLKTKYSGGPIIERTVINLGSWDMPKLEVELHPVRFEVFVCTKAKTRVEPTDKPDLIHFESKTSTMMTVVNVTHAALKLKGWSRCWFNLNSRKFSNCSICG